MVLGYDAIVKKLKDGELVFSSMPDPGSKKFDRWCKEFIQPASIDVPLGNFIYAIPVANRNSHASQFMQNAKMEAIRTDETGHQYHTKWDLNDYPNGLAIVPGGMVLAHTEDSIFFGPSVAGQVATRSTARRWGLDVCGSAGWVDPGFNSKITLEILNTQSIPIYIRKGVCYAQLILFEVDPGEGKHKAYDGHYNVPEWSPESMLPKNL